MRVFSDVSQRTYFMTVSSDDITGEMAERSKAPD